MVQGMKIRPGSCTRWVQNEPSMATEMMPGTAAIPDRADCGWVSEAVRAGRGGVERGRAPSQTSSPSQSSVRALDPR